MEVTINKYDNTVAFVVVDKDANVFVWNTASGAIIIVDDEQLYRKLPGRWDILFRNSEATESDAQKIVHRQKLASPGTYAYRNYHSIQDYPYWTGVRAMQTLFEAHSIQLTEHQDLLILKKVEK